MAIETELKLHISPEHLQKLKRHPFIRSLSADRARTLKLYSIYYDTADLELRSRVVGFLDDDRSKQGTQVNGVPVVGGLDALPEAIGTFEVSQVIISTNKVPLPVVERIRAICEDADISVVQAALRFE